MVIADLNPLLRGSPGETTSAPGTPPPSSARPTTTRYTGSAAWWSRSGAGNCEPGRPGRGRKSGSTGTALTGSAAPSATRRQR